MLLYNKTLITCYFVKTNTNVSYSKVLECGFTTAKKFHILIYFLHLRSVLDYNYFFGVGEHSQEVTEVFRLLPRRHLSLHHNDKEGLATETGAVE